jgi:hypothetical protein
VEPVLYSFPNQIKIEQTKENYRPISPMTYIENLNEILAN